VGKANLLSKVTRPFGGTVELDYSREGNVVGTFQAGDGTVQKVDMPEARWCLSRVTVTDGLVNGSRYTDTIGCKKGTSSGAVLTALSSSTLTSQYVSQTNIFDLVYEGFKSAFTIGNEDPRAVFRSPGLSPDAPLWHNVVRLFDSEGNLSQVTDFRDPSSFTDDL